MHEIFQNLAKKAGGLREPGMRGDGVWYFVEPDLERLINLLIDEKNNEIEDLKRQLFTAKAQNDIYKGVIYDSH